MVKEKEHNGKVYYKCEECDMYYRDRKIAQNCEDYCNKKHACNMEITKYAVEINEDKKCNC